MKKLLACATLLFGLLAFTAVAADKSALLSASQMVWVGLDFSRVRLIGTRDAFKDTDDIFSRQFESWNDPFCAVGFALASLRAAQ